MELTARDREFLEAVAQDTLPRYETLGALRRAARRLMNKGLLTQSRFGDWTRFSLTTEGRAALSTTPLADALAVVDKAQAEVWDNWSRGADEALVEASRELAETVRLHLAAHPESG